MITPEDKELLAKKGISEVQIAEQLACFQKGFPYLKLDAAASVEKGILAPDAEEQKAYLAAWNAYTNSDKTIVKFVPASGAASRMFKNLFEFLDADYTEPTTKFEQTFFESIEKFAFYDDLNTACVRTEGKGIPTLIAEGNYKAVVSGLLNVAGLNYGALPKGLLKFHKYEEGSRTPLEEHLAEGAMYHWLPKKSMLLPNVMAWIIISLSPNRNQALIQLPLIWKTSHSAITVSFCSVPAGMVR